MGSSFFKYIQQEMHTEADRALVEHIERVSEKIQSLDTHVFLKPSDISISEIYEIVGCKNLTMFTYTVGVGFAKLVSDSIKNCTGKVRLVFSLTNNQKPNYLGEKKECIKSRESERKGKLYNTTSTVINELVKLNNQRVDGASLEIFIQNLSHIKLLQRDDHIIYGSVNFSKKSDASIKKQYLSYDELLCESHVGGAEVADLMWDYMRKKYPNINPIEIPKEPCPVTIQNIIEEALECSMIEYNYSKVSSTTVKSIKVDKQELIDGIQRILSLNKTIFLEDPELNFYSLVRDQELNCYFESINIQSSKQLPSHIADELYGYVNSLIIDFRKGCTEPESAIEARYESEIDELFDPSEEDKANFRSKIRQSVEREISERENNFIRSFNEKLTCKLESEDWEGFFDY